MSNIIRAAQDVDSIELLVRLLGMPPGFMPKQPTQGLVRHLVMTGGHRELLVFHTASLLAAAKMCGIDG